MKRLVHERRAAGRLRRSLAGLAITLALTSGTTAQQPRRSWVDFNGGPDSSHYSASRQITKSNVTQLEIAWTYSTRDNTAYLFNPIVVDNVMYVLARNNSLVAIDATTGKEKWIHAGLQGIAGRGINYWESRDRRDRRLLFQIRNQLQAIDAVTGESILSFGTNGYVDLRQGLGRDPMSISRVQSSTPGKVFEDLIILGSAPGENFLSPPGDLRAFDVRTGKLAWQFHTLPHPGEMGYDTWPKDAWKYVGGVNTWGEISVDARRGIAYFPLGSGTYDFYGADRKGANLFANCILALDARTGKYKWHFQEVHHDLWDYDAVSAPQLVTIRHNGRNVDVVAHAGKTGFLYVLDRETGKPIWPIEERPVPASTMPEEQAHPTQPFPTVVPAFGRQKFTVEDVNPLLADPERTAMIDRVKNAVNQGLFTPPAMKDTVSMPGNRGGSNWGTTGANPEKGLVYVLSIDAPSLLRMSIAPPSAGGIGRAGAFINLGGPELYQDYCAECHKPDFTGSAEAPSLVDVTTRLGADAVGTLIKFGAGRMPAFTGLSDSEIARITNFLSTSSAAAGRGGGAAGGGRGGGAGAAGGRGGGAGGAGRGAGGPAPGVSAEPDGPVVASGGAPAGQTAPQPQGLINYGSMEGPPYPEGIERPRGRYFTGWNVLYDAIAGPWNTLTAYDLNKGTIRWKVPLGNQQNEQRGVLTTASGLVFLATGDGKVRAYDEEDGKLLWTGDLPGGSRSAPAMYEVDGRQFLVISATQNIAGAPAPATPAAGAAAPTAPVRGYVAFALPSKGK